MHLLRLPTKKAMKIQQFPYLNPKPPAGSRQTPPSGPPDSDREAHLPVDSVLSSVAGVGFGATLGVAAGLAEGVAGHAARWAVGAGGGFIVGSLVGGVVGLLLATEDRKLESWMKGMVHGSGGGMMLGGVMGLLSEPSIPCAGVLGTVCAVAGLLSGPLACAWVQSLKRDRSD